MLSHVGGEQDAAQLVQRRHQSEGEHEPTGDKCGQLPAANPMILPGAAPQVPNTTQVQPRAHSETEDDTRLETPSGPEVVGRERAAVVRVGGRSGKSGQGGKSGQSGQK
jgi:hypothetical protein